MIKIKEGDTARTLTDTLLLDGSAIDLTGATVVLVWRLPNGVVNRRSATIVDEEAGRVSYAPTIEDVGTAGRHALEWEITFAGGGVLTVPSSGYIQLVVARDLG